MTIPVWDKEVLGLDEQRIGLRGSPTRVTRITRPKVSRGGERFEVKSEEDLGTAAGRIIEYLEDNSLL
jgi:electron transfer flavoprotein beta subunit